MEKFEYKTLFTDAKGVLGGKVDQTEYQNELYPICPITACQL